MRLRYQIKDTNDYFIILANNNPYISSLGIHKNRVTNYRSPGKMKYLNIYSQDCVLGYDAVRTADFHRKRLPLSNLNYTFKVLSVFETLGWQSVNIENKFSHI